MLNIVHFGTAVQSICKRLCPMGGPYMTLGSHGPKDVPCHILKTHQKLSLLYCSFSPNMARTILIPFP